MVQCSVVDLQLCSVVVNSAAANFRYQRTFPGQSRVVAICTAINLGQLCTVHPIPSSAGRDTRDVNRDTRTPRPAAAAQIASRQLRCHLGANYEHLADQMAPPGLSADLQLVPPSRRPPCAHAGGARPQRPPGWAAAGPARAIRPRPEDRGRARGGRRHGRGHSCHCWPAGPVTSVWPSARTWGVGNISRMEYVTVVPSMKNGGCHWRLGSIPCRHRSATKFCFKGAFWVFLRNNHWGRKLDQGRLCQTRNFLFVSNKSFWNYLYM